MVIDKVLAGLVKFVLVATNPLRVLVATTTGRAKLQRLEMRARVDAAELMPEQRTDRKLDGCQGGVSNGLCKRSC